MTRLLSATLIVSVLAFSSAHAQLGNLCIFADPSASECNITDNVPGIVTVYLVHLQSVGARGIRYSAPIPYCWTGAVFLADQFQFPVFVGGSQTGVSVSYGDCVSGAVVVQSILVFGQGLAQPDCPYPVLPDPATYQIEVVDCSNNIVPGNGGTSYINSFIPCECSGGTMGPLLSVSPTLIDFQEIYSERSFNVTNVGTGTLSWNVAESIPWLDATPTSGTDEGTVSLSVDRTGLALGHYSGIIEVTSNGGSQNVDVEMDVAVVAPELSVIGPDSLHFDMDTQVQYVIIDNTGNADLNYNLSVDEPWLDAAPSSGTITAVGSPQQLTITIDRTGLSDGEYSQFVHITSNGGNADIPVTATVYTGPAIEVSPTQLDFTPDVTQRTFSIYDVGLTALTWTLSADQPWIQIAPPLSGTGGAVVTVDVDPDLVPAGDVVTGTVMVSSNGGVATVAVAYLRSGAPGGILGLYSDPDASSCAIQDIDGLVNVYAVLTANPGPGATAIQFAAPKPPCMQATWVADTSPFPLVLGDTQNGVAVAFSMCLATPIHVLTLQYVGTGTTGACCEYPVIPDPHAPTGTIEVVDCADTKTFAMSRPGFVNPDGGCPCGLVVKVETKTWGAVKALYLPEK